MGLVQQVSKPIKKTTLLGKSNFRCAHCGKTMHVGYADLTIEHIIPRSRGGTNAPWNLCVLCQKCNVAKGSRLVDIAEYYEFLNEKSKKEVLGHVAELRWKLGYERA